MKRSNPIRDAAIVALVAVFAGAAGAMAQDRRVSNAGLPELEDIEPLYNDPLGMGIHNIRLTVETGYARTQNVGQPTELDQRSFQTSIGVSAEFVEVLFGSVTGTFSHENITSTNLAFALPMIAEANVTGVDAAVGIRPLPFLSLGGIAGVGRGSASYEFVAAPGVTTPGDSATRRLGAFLNAFYGQGEWTLNGTATVLDVRTEQDYGPMNIPQFDSYGATLLLFDANVDYQLTDDVTVTGGITFNQVLSQVVPAAQTGLDDNWFNAYTKLTYSATDQIDLFARAMTWLGNDRQSFARISAGISYRF